MRLQPLLQPAHQQAALGEQGGDLGDVGERRVRLGEVAREVLEGGALELRIALLRVQLDKRAGVFLEVGADDRRYLFPCRGGW